nr:hypothetical protein GCM10025730_24460 [Promicromonospora thailandica]
MSTTPVYPARAVVDLDAIRDNVRALRTIAPTAQVMAVVKADAYGHGLAPAARAALAGGATWLGAAQTREALAARAAVGPGPRVLTWLYAPGAPFEDLVRADVDIAVAAAWALDEVADGARAAGRGARVHLKVDTGLGRNGIMPGDLPGVLDRAAALQAEGSVSVVGVMSHFALADEPDDPSVKMQSHAFDEAIRAVEAAGLPVEVRHIANSAATLTNPATHHDLVRPGIAVYGLSPVPQLGAPGDYGLRPAMTLEARLATVKRVPAGHGVSYGHFYTTAQETVLGVIPLGYGDGIPGTPPAARSARAGRSSSAAAWATSPHPTPGSAPPACCASPGACAWTRSCSTWARTLRSRPVTWSPCSGPRTGSPGPGRPTPRTGRRPRGPSATRS